MEALAGGFIEETTSWSSDTLTLTVKTPMKAGVLYGFAIAFKNSKTASSGCSPTIAGNGISPMTMSGTVGVVDLQGWKTAKIGQVSTRPLSLNYICITLSPNKDFISSNPIGGKTVVSKFTISGLTGSGSATGVHYVTSCPASAPVAVTTNTSITVKRLPARRRMASVRDVDMC